MECMLMENKTKIITLSQNKQTNRNKTKQKHKKTKNHPEREIK